MAAFFVAAFRGPLLWPPCVAAAFVAVFFVARFRGPLLWPPCVAAAFVAASFVARFRGRRALAVRRGGVSRSWA
ncbi:MAG: hypothetical protein K6A32_03775 [Bacteroidales bacterium]|nr:hypothetical protein [Bacteroidales bacterium]